MRIFYLVKKEFLETIRQKEMLFLMLVAPIIQIILLGYVVTTDIKNIPVEIINLSKNKETVNIINRIIPATPPPEDMITPIDNIQIAHDKLVHTFLNTNVRWYN